MRLTEEQALQDNMRFANCNTLAELKYCGWNIPHRKSITNDEIRFYAWLCRSAVSMLKEQEPRILSLGEAIEGKNGLEIDPYVFVEIKGREDIFIGTVNDASHYNYPNLSFDVGECFQVNRSFPASKIYLNTDYMKTVRCWTHKPSKEQRKAVKWV